MLDKSTLFIPFAIVLVFAVIQLALVSRMVAFLHIQKTKIQTYHIDGNGSGLNFYLHVLPGNLSLNQGHTTNGAAGYGLVMSIVFLIVTFLMRTNNYNAHHKTILLTMTICLVLLFLFILTACVYVFSVTYLTIGNTIDISLAQALAGKSYNIDAWTPETWYRALLSLPLDQQQEHSLNLSGAYHEMVAWRWWILPYLFISAIMCAWVAVVYYKERRTTDYLSPISMEDGGHVDGMGISQKPPRL